MSVSTGFFALNRTNACYLNYGQVGWSPHCFQGITSSWGRMDCYAYGLISLH